MNHPLGRRMDLHYPGLYSICDGRGNRVARVSHFLSLKLNELEQGRVDSYG